MRTNTVDTFIGHLKEKATFQKIPSNGIKPHDRLLKHSTSVVLLKLQHGCGEIGTYFLIRMRSVTFGSAADGLGDGSFAEARRRYIEKLTENAKSEGSVGTNLVDLLMSTKSLITTNQEIWDRCKTNRSRLSRGILCYSRVSLFPQVMCRSDDDKKHLSVIAGYEVTSKDFGAPPSVPAILQESLPLNMPNKNPEYPSKIGNLPDYLSYTEKASLLHEDILIPFLQNFKQHLEDVQVFLTGIETWLSEPANQLDFLHDLFRTKISLPDEPEILCSAVRRCPGHSKMDICQRCGQSYELHDKRYGGHKCDSGDQGRFWIKHPGEPIVLAKLPFRGTMDAVFPFRNSHEKRKLKAFKDFIYCP